MSYIVQYLKFQKKSPYASDINDFLGIANQMDFIMGKFEESLDNGTKCSSWNDIYKSHADSEKNSVLKFDDIQGTLILLCMGLGSATLVFLLENVNYRVIKLKVPRM